MTEGRESEGDERRRRRGGAEREQEWIDFSLNAGMSLRGGEGRDGAWLEEKPRQFSLQGSVRSMSSRPRPMGETIHAQIL